ncbi:MAG TPA: hypothetical protein VIO14_13175 [Dehalococcoidia bacterium]
MAFGRAWYRVRQFREAVRAAAPGGEEDERAVVAAYLTETQQSLFFTMTRRDRRHSVQTCRLLLEQGHRDPDLLAAALLHDVGKGRIRLWHRVAYVLLSAAAPRLLRRLARPGGEGWRAVLYRSLHHPEAGAAQALAAGASAETARLIREHHAPATDDERLRALIRADEEA